MAPDLSAARYLSRGRPWQWQAVVLVWLLFAGIFTCRAGDSTEANNNLMVLGQRIYREGILPSGVPLRGLARPSVIRTGADAACVACHRRSGYGMTEGNVVTRPITGQALFQTQSVVAANPRIAHQLGQPVRPPYDEQTLVRAIRDGVNVTGRPLGDGMPRYALGDEDIKPLLAYLKSLSTQPEPGVTDADIHLATVIQPGVSAKKKTAMLDVLTFFLNDKNAGTRWDEQRRQAGIMRMQRAYRKWNLHVWELTGSPETWDAQLLEYYRRQPVFAIVGGLGEADWSPIHEFSERFRVPCIFPQTGLPGRAGSRFYTLYLSRGILLEADVLARYLADRLEPQKVIQVFRHNAPGEAAARQFRAVLPSSEKRLTDRVINGAINADFWRQLAAEAEGAALVLWLDAADLDGAGPLLATRQPASTIFLSSILLDGLAAATPLAAAGSATLLVYPWDSPNARDKAQSRTNAWLQRKGIAATDDPVFTNTFFAVNIVGDVLSHILDSFSREYFIERIEHAVQQSLVASSFPHVSLGPDQRFAAKGSYVVRLDPDKEFTAVSGWIVP